MTDAIQIQIRPTAAAFPALRQRGTWTRRDWRTVAHTDAQTIEQTRLALQQTAPDHLYEYRAIRENPPAHLHIPATVAQLGTVLDLTTQIDATRTTWEIADLAGMVLTTDAGAMDMRPGHAALYLLRTQAQHRAPNARMDRTKRPAFTRALEAIEPILMRDERRALHDAIFRADLDTIRALQRGTIDRPTTGRDRPTAADWTAILDEAKENWGFWGTTGAHKDRAGNRTPNAGKQHRIDLNQAMQRIHAALYPDEALAVRDAMRAGRYEFIRSMQRQTQGRVSAPGAPPPPSAEDWQALINEATDQAHKRRQQNPPNARTNGDSADNSPQRTYALAVARALIAQIKSATKNFPHITADQLTGDFVDRCHQYLVEGESIAAVVAQLRAEGTEWRDVLRSRNGSRNDEAQAEAGATYAEWHERDPEQITHAEDLPDVIGIYIGRALRIGYRSDKWHERGQTEDYDHDYTEPGYQPPEVWADHADLSKARAIVIVGGNQRITADGID
jgi:hypothetical protein